MAVSYRHLKLRGSAVMPDDNVTLGVGGAKDLTKKPLFTNVAGLVEIVANAPAASGQTVTLTYRDVGDSVLTEAKQTNGGGLTPVAFVAADIDRILKAVLTGPSASGINIAVRAQVPERQDTLGVGSTTEFVVLDSGAASGNGVYEGMVLTIDSGPASGSVVEGVKYIGADRKLYVSDLLSLAPSGGYTLSRGLMFDGAPGPVTEVRRVFYGAQAETVEGETRNFHDKVFWHNAHPTDSLTDAEVTEDADAPGVVALGVAATKNDVGTNGATNNRLTAPTGITFNAGPQAVPTGTLAPNDGIGTWLKRTAVAGSGELEAEYVIGINGDAA